MNLQAMVPCAFFNFVLLRTIVMHAHKHGIRGDHRSVRAYASILPRKHVLVFSYRAICGQHILACVVAHPLRHGGWLLIFIA